MLNAYKRVFNTQLHRAAVTHETSRLKELKSKLLVCTFIPSTNIWPHCAMGQDLCNKGVNRRESSPLLKASSYQPFSVICCSQYPSEIPIVQFSHSVVSDSLRAHGLQHARLPCPSPTPRAYSNSRPSSQWCHPTISSSAIYFSSCLQPFPASGSFPVSQFFASGGQLQHQSVQWMFRIDFL